MTFFKFLAFFLVVPIALLLWAERHRLKGLFVLPILTVALGSVFYTAPWDNWLLEHRVWWTDEARCSGIKVASVPLEELFFYVCIILLGGLWTHFLYHRVKPEFGPAPKRPWIRFVGAGVLSLAWVADVYTLFFLTARWPQLTFLAQCLLITLPALILQFAVCGDLFWHRRRFLLAAVLPEGIWLTLTAGFSTFGTELWVVDPRYSLGRIPHMLPIEMPFFYVLASALVVFPASVLVAFDKSYFQEWLDLAALLFRRIQRA